MGLGLGKVPHVHGGGKKPAHFLEFVNLMAIIEFFTLQKNTTGKSDWGRGVCRIRKSLENCP